ncbi:nucleoside 2-deoxyribosyltransferase [Leptospira idonii]|uniref:Nucleoside 2-deoxyribosyltransferase n=1 Tax=Leptospira idonii TaxID=1193500 RepID=A0A4R9M1G8_9LEPT|nr:nucleoside 2-deoxyribosyltransferase [Leptospira idonii]
MSPNYGNSIENFKHYDLFAKDLHEALFILSVLKEKKQIEFDISVIHDNKIFIRQPILIKEPGWVEIEKLEQPHLSKQVFIAIWFDPSMNQAYQEIENACRSNGYTPIRIDYKQHNNEISGEILFEIRKSKFLISEVTGQRHGVYFEAGYAMGLGLPVIWCCKQSDLSNVHFDTRQYNHVVWDTTQELFDRLEKRIRSTIY